MIIFQFYDNFAAMMRLRNIIIPVASSLALGIMSMACGGGKNGSPGYRWDTGSAYTDSLLAVSDSLLWHDDVEDMEIDEIFDSIRKDCRKRDGDPRARAVELFIQSPCVMEDGKNMKSWRIDSAALAQITPEMAPYLYHRIALTKAQVNPHVKGQADDLYRLISFFKEINDSISLFEAYFELNYTYGEIADFDAQLACMEQALRYTPGRDTTLRNLMEFNILTINRSYPDKRYMERLDSMRSKKEFMKTIEPAGVEVYCDLYKLHGNDADLDTAGYYIGLMSEEGHDAFKIYYAQRLRQAIKGNPKDSVEYFARYLKSWTKEPTSVELETFPILIDYYRMKGDTASEREVSHAYELLVAKWDTGKEATNIARIKSDRHKENYLSEHINFGKTGDWTVWLVIGLLLLAFVALAWFMLWRHRHRKASEKLSSELDTMRRRLLVEQMKKIEKTQSDDDWAQFQALFVEMRPGFTGKLREAYPMLTKGDIELCALLALNVDTKHIARLRGINNESVKKHKQRLRAKIGLSRNTEWQQFLSQFYS